MIRIAFGKKRIAPVVRERLAMATERLHALTGDHYFIVTAPFGKVRSFETDNLIMVWVSTHHRPGKSTVVAIAEGDRLLLPSQIEEDYVELSKLLGAHSAEEMSQIREVVSPCRDRR